MTGAADTSDRGARIAAAVAAYRPDDDAEPDAAPLIALHDDDRREALIRLGYSTRSHLAMLGLDR